MRVLVVLKFYQNFLLACNYVFRNAVFVNKKGSPAKVGGLGKKFKLF